MLNIRNIFNLSCQQLKSQHRAGCDEHGGWAIHIVHSQMDMITQLVPCFWGSHSTDLINRRQVVDKKVTHDYLRGLPTVQLSLG